MYKLILVDFSASQSDAIQTIQNIVTLLEDDCLSQSEKESLKPLICGSSDQEEALPFAALKEYGIDKIVQTPFKYSTIHDLVTLSEIY